MKIRVTAAQVFDVNVEPNKVEEVMANIRRQIDRMLSGYSQSDDIIRNGASHVVTHYSDHPVISSPWNNGKIYGNTEPLYRSSH